MNYILFILLAIIGFFMVLQIFVRLRSWRLRGKPAPKVGGPLGKAISKGDKVLAYFYSPTCSACRTQEKYLHSIQEKFDRIHRINAAKDRSTASAFSVMGTPTTIIVDGGVIKEYFTGITSSNKILSALNVN